ncbi:MAG: hypothetical protein QNK04_15780, partial [Myxococcota bacterium]|nr:hypothetical protein [Myxococcota bacterium]
MSASAGRRRLAIALIGLAFAAPSGAIELPVPPGQGAYAIFEWEPSSGATFHYVYVSRNGAPRQLEMLRFDNTVRINGELNETIQVWVQGATQRAVYSEFSMASEPVTFVAAGGSEPPVEEPPVEEPPVEEPPVEEPPVEEPPVEEPPVEEPPVEEPPVEEPPVEEPPVEEPP